MGSTDNICVSLEVIYKTRQRSAVQPSLYLPNNKLETISVHWPSAPPPPHTKHNSCLLYRSLRNAALWGPICASKLYNFPLAALLLYACWHNEQHIRVTLRLLVVLSCCAIMKSSRQLQSADFTHLVHKTFCSHNLAASGGLQSGFTYLLLYMHALFCAVLKINSAKIRPW